MPKVIESIMFAPCGMNCMVCYVHLKEKKPCSGCLCDDNNKPESCKKCKIKNCSECKGYIYCYECAEFPCKQIKSLNKSYLKRYQVSLIDNSLAVKEYSLKIFMNNERLKWTCIKCNGVISLHDKECSGCGGKLPDCCNSL